MFCTGVPMIYNILNKVLHSEDNAGCSCLTDNAMATVSLFRMPLGTCLAIFSKNFKQTTKMRQHLVSMHAITCSTPPDDIMAVQFVSVMAMRSISKQPYNWTLLLSGKECNALYTLSKLSHSINVGECVSSLI